MWYHKSSPSYPRIGYITLSCQSQLTSFNRNFRVNKKWRHTAHAHWDWLAKTNGRGSRSRWRVLPVLSANIQLMSATYLQMPSRGIRLNSCTTTAPWHCLIDESTIIPTPFFYTSYRSYRVQLTSGFEQLVRGTADSVAVGRCMEWKLRLIGVNMSNNKKCCHCCTCYALNPQINNDIKWQRRDSTMRCLISWSVYFSDNDRNSVYGRVCTRKMVSYSTSVKIWWS